jgi:CheY-like chemotaxis protein
MNASKGSQPCTILYIEEDENDVYIFRHAFVKSRIPCAIQNVESVEEAEKYLTGSGVYSDREKFPVPTIIITDLAFRHASGIDFLNWLRYHPEFASIPVLCLSATEDPRKLEQARQFGVDCIGKSSMYEEVLKVIESVLERTP